MNFLRLVRLLIVTAVCLGLAVGLGREVVRGLASGKLAHSDSSTYCRRDTNPLGYWALIALFSALAVGSLATWGSVVYDAVARQ